MNVTFHQSLHDGSGSAGFATLDLELPFAPTLNMAFQKRPWGEERTPSKVYFDIDEDAFFVMFKLEEHASKQSAGSQLRAYEDCGWETHP